MRRDTRGKTVPIRQPKADLSEQSFAFRRSRTITGSAASSVRAAGEERGQLQSSRLHEHSLRKHRRKLILYLGLSLVAVGALLYVVTSYIGSSVQVGLTSTQPVQGTLDNTRYESLTKQYFATRPFERFSFAFNANTFDAYMRSNAPEISEAHLEKGTRFGAAALSLRLREPVVTWTIKNQQYFVDAEGFAYTVNYFQSPSVIVTDRSGISADAGVVASSKLLRFIGRVITLVNAAGVSSVETVELPQNSTREVNFKLKDHDYIIKAHLDRDPAGQAADIVSAVRYTQTKGIDPQYLDVRVSSKAFYRDKR